MDADTLALLFTGEEDYEGGWLTAPCPTVPLAVRLCEELRPATFEVLVRRLYGPLPLDDLPGDVLDVPKEGYTRWAKR